MRNYALNRFNVALSLLLQDLEQGPGPNVCDQLQAAIVLENAPPELEVLKGVGLAIGAAGQPSSIGNTSTVQFFNPATSQFVATIDALMGLSGNAVGLGYHVAKAAPFAGSVEVGAKAFLDGRMAGTPGLQIHTRAQGAPVLIAEGVVTMNPGANNWGPWTPVRIPLTPGMICRVFPLTSAPNASGQIQSAITLLCCVHAQWRERVLSDAELQVGG